MEMDQRPALLAFAVVASRFGWFRSGAGIGITGTGGAIHRVPGHQPFLHHPVQMAVNSGLAHLDTLPGKVGADFGRRHVLPRPGTQVGGNLFPLPGLVMLSAFHGQCLP